MHLCQSVCGLLEMHPSSHGSLKPLESRPRAGVKGPLGGSDHVASIGLPLLGRACY